VASAGNIFCAENLTWLFVFIVGSTATALGVLIANGITVRRAHNVVRLRSEVLANQHLTSLAFFPALIVAFNTLTEVYKWACFVVMFVSVIFFVVGMFNIREHEGLLTADHSCSEREDCAIVLKPELRRKIGRLNLLLATISVLSSVTLIFCLQSGK
jgi:4-amino-4-deoxy-L-arabinose transferase-like glycosyltransferase